MRPPRVFERCLPWVIVLAVLPPAFAQDRQATVEQQLKEHREKLESLEKQLEGLKSGQLAKSAEAKKEVENNKVKLTLEYDQGFVMKSADKRFSFQVNGRLQMDAQARLTGRDRNHGSTSINGFKERRVFLGAKGTIYKYWNFVVTGTYESGTVLSGDDNYIETTYIEQAKLRFGQFKVPFSLESNTSDLFVKLIERSMAVDAFTPSRNQGLMVHGEVLDKRIAYWAMLGNGNRTERSDNDDDKYGWARLVIRPFQTSENKWIKGLHIGASGGVGKQDKLAPSLDSPGVVQTATGTRIIEYASGVTLDGESLRGGLEFGWLAGPFMLTGEYLILRQELRNGTDGDPRGPFSRREDSRFRGGHVTAAYLLTGENQSYGRIYPKNNYEPGHPDSGPGAWELAARYDFVETEKGDTAFFIGGLNVGGTAFVLKPERVQQVMAGVNWYPNPAVKVSLNWQSAWWTHQVGEGFISGRAPPAVGSPKQPKNQNTLMMRVQIDF